MPHVHVCPLSRIAETVATAQASHLVTLINLGTPVRRPPTIAAANHLYLGMNDVIDTTDGMITPGEDHVQDLLAFVTAWDRRRPLVVHCYAGVSRSTAAAFITVCALRPDRSEIEIAENLRLASSHATPNPRLVALGDELLGRQRRMIDAIASIGRGAMAAEGTPFRLAVGD